MNNQQALNSLTLPFHNDNVELQFTHNYPKDGKHLTLNLTFTPLPCSISKGDDTFWYTNKKGEEKESKKHLWYVHFHNTTTPFKKVEDAFNFATQHYIHWLQQQIIDTQLIS